MKANNTAEHDRQEASGRGHCVAQTWLMETLGILFQKNRSCLFMQRLSVAESKTRPSGEFYKIPRIASLCFLHYRGQGSSTVAYAWERAHTGSDGQ